MLCGEVWKRTSLSVTRGLAPCVRELVMTSILCRGERNVQCPSRLFWVLNVISGALYCQKQEVCPAPGLEQSAASVTQLLGWPTVPAAFWAVLLWFSCELLCAEPPQTGHCHPFASCMWWCWESGNSFCLIIARSSEYLSLTASCISIWFPNRSVQIQFPIQVHLPNFLFQWLESCEVETCFVCRPVYPQTFAVGELCYCHPWSMLPVV